MQENQQRRQPKPCQGFQRQTDDRPAKGAQQKTRGYGRQEQDRVMHTGQHRRANCDGGGTGICFAFAGPLRHRLPDVSSGERRRPAGPGAAGWVGGGAAGLAPVAYQPCRAEPRATCLISVQVLAGRDREPVVERQRWHRQPGLRRREHGRD